VNWLRPRDFAREPEQHMLRWATDVQASQGNLLVLHGLVKFRTPEHKGSSRYRLRWRDRTIGLHSYCVTFCGGGRPGLRFIRGCQRDYLCSHAEPPAPCDHADESLRLPCAPQELAMLHDVGSELRRWLAEHAAWRRQVLSQNCIRPFRHRQIYP